MSSFGISSFSFSSSGISHQAGEIERKQLLAKGLCQLNIKNIIPVLKLDGNNNFNNDFSTPGNNLNETFETPRPETENNNQNDFFIDEDLKHPLVN